METFLGQISTSVQKLFEKLSNWLDSIILIIPNVLLAAIVMTVSIFLARFVNRYVRKILRRISSNVTVNGVLSNVATAGFLLLMLFVVLDILELQTALTSLLAGAGVAGLAIGLALQEPLINIFSGILMSVKSLYNVGDLVETNGYFGVIEEISLRATLLRTPLGQEVSIPNKMVIQSPLENFTNTCERRIVLNCGISYGEDLERVKTIAIQAIKDHCSFDESRGVEFFYTGFGNSSIDFILRFWIKKCRQVDFLKSRSDAVIGLKKAFDQNGITIPFPIRTLDFGIKGGQKLNEMLVRKANGNNQAPEDSNLT